MAAMARNVGNAMLVVVLCLAGALVADAVVGGPKDVGNFGNCVELHDLATFAVNKWNSEQNSIDELIFSKLVAVKEQVVQGRMYYLTIEVVEAGSRKLYDAKVWVKPWENFKELESFAPSASQFTPSDLGVKADCAQNTHKKHQIVT